MMKTRVALFTLAFCAIAGSAFWAHSLKKTERKIASVVLDSKESAGKRATLLGENSRRVRTHGKGNSLVAIEIQAPGKRQVTAGSVITLQARVEAKMSLHGLRYLWLLPKDGITVLGGALEGDIGSLDDSEIAELELSVQSATNENRHIHLHVYRVVDGENQGAMEQYNTVDQEAIEEKATLRAESIQKAAEASGKFHHKLIQ